MPKESTSEPAISNTPRDITKDLGACFCDRDTLGVHGIHRRCAGFFRRPVHITDTRPGVLMGRLWDPESHRKDNLRYHYNPAWAGPLEANLGPPITAEANSAHAAGSVQIEREPTTRRRSRSVRQLVTEDSNAIKQSNMSFGETLESLRLRSSQSRYRLAESSGISEPYILRLESGEMSNPSREVVIKLGLSLIKGSKALEIWEFDVLLLSAGYA
ncbi:MAG: helix-turn-helix domain-containing protein [Chloroflexi bacterium]|nr:helix-turn-helix domain-containing protein [Chloroflexota bacterium]